MSYFTPDNSPAVSNNSCIPSFVPENPRARLSSMVKLPRLKPVYAFCRDSSETPILFALSLISVIAVSANPAAFSVSPPTLLNKAAEKLVTVDIYSFADSPAALYAFSAYPITVSAEFLKSVSTPPTSCSYSA